jgi:hypothetical protein
MKKQIPIEQLGQIRDRAILRLLAANTQVAIAEAVAQVRSDATIASNPRVSELLSEIDYLAAITKVAIPKPRETKRGDFRKNTQ